MKKLILYEAISLYGAVSLSLILLTGVFTAYNFASASPATDIQPASITYNEDLKVNGTARFNSAYIGKTTGEGGVTFFNGTIINASRGSVPVTFGDDVRIDGMIWRGTSKGTSDNMPLKIADSIVPALTNTNSFGSSDLKWKDGYFAGNLTVGNLIGDDIIHTNEIATTNDPQSNQLLSYNGEALEWVTVGTSSSDDGDGDDDGDTGDIIVGDITSVTAGTGLSGGGTSGGVTLSVADSGITSAMIFDGTITGSDLDTDYVNVSGDTMTGILDVNAATTTDNDALVHSVNSSTSSGSAGVKGDATGSITGANYGGYFTAAGTTGRGVYGEATNTSSSANYGGYFLSYSSSGGVGVAGITSGSSGYGVYGGANSSSGTNYGGYFETGGNTGRAVYGYASHIAGSNYGGYFISGGSSGRAVYGLAGNTVGTNYGGYFETNSSSGYSGYFKGNRVGFEDLSTTSEAANVYLGQVSGNIYRLYRSTSSRRYKENIRDLEVKTADVLQLQGVRFEEKSTGKEIIGLIAEDVNEHIPDLVEFNEKGQPEGVKYDRVSVYLLEVIKEQQERLNNQEEKINNLKTAICDKFPEEDICR